MSPSLTSRASRLIRREKAFQLGRRKHSASMLEKKAQEWVKEQEREKRRQVEKAQKERVAEVTSTSVSLEEDEKKSVEVGYEGLDWAPNRAGQDESSAEKKRVFINAATVRALAKKMIAREWRRALGKPPPRPLKDKLEKEAEAWRKAKDLEKRIQEEKEQRLIEATKDLNTVLSEFAKRLVNVTIAENNARLDELFREYVGDLGEIYLVEWSEDGCQIWFEPWTEIKGRRIAGVADPVIYTAVIDASFKISSIALVEDEESLNRLQAKDLKEMFSRLMAQNRMDENNIEDLLEDALSEKGRLLALAKTDNGWEANLELWEAMRLRNQKKLGEEFAQLTDVVIDYKDGDISFRVRPCS